MIYTKVIAKWSLDMWAVYNDSNLIVSSGEWPLSSVWLRSFKSSHNYQVEYLTEEQLDLLKLELL